VIPISQRNLANLAKEMRNYNVFPIYLDWYESPDGAHPLCGILGRLVDEAVELLDASTDEELVGYKARLHWFYASHIADDLLSVRELQTVRALAFYIVSTLVDPLFSDIHPIVRSDYLEKSAVFSIYPELRAHHSDEGLLRLDVPGLRITRSGLFYRDHFLHCHQFLRRYFTSNPNFDFLQRLSTYTANHPKHSVAIAIDHRRIMPLEHFAEFIEKDAWFGPPFSWDKIDDPYAVGLTVHARHPDSVENMTYELDRMEFHWSYDNGLKTLQTEELRPDTDESRKSGYVINRYLHAIRDISKRAFVHMDGAVKLYAPSQYTGRFKTNLPKGAKGERKIKLFRIDGDIPDREWSDLASFFFRQNELVLEYLNPELAEKLGFGRQRFPRSTAGRSS